MTMQLRYVLTIILLSHVILGINASSVENLEVDTALHDRARRQIPFPGGTAKICRYYVLHQTSRSWETAQSACKTGTLEGKLATVHMESLNNRLTNLILDNGISDAWFGANLLSNPLQWTYTDNSNACFQKWGNAMIPGTSNCALLRTDSNWEDADCSESRPYMCELTVTESVLSACHPLNPCRNGGVCTDVIGGYTCQCPRGFSGDDCESCAMETSEINGQFTPVTIGNQLDSSGVERITSFTINSDLYVLTSGATSTDVVRVYKFDTGGFSPLVPGDFFNGHSMEYVSHMEPFVIGDRHFLAVAITIGPGVSTIFEWSSGDSKFIELDNNPFGVGSHFNFFSTSHGRFLVLTVFQNMGSSTVIADSVVVKWNPITDAFDHFQDIPTNRAFESTSFTDDETTYLLFARTANDVDMYQLTADGMEFKSYTPTTIISETQGFSKFTFQCKPILITFDSEAFAHVWENGDFTPMAFSEYAFLNHGSTCTIEIDQYPVLVITNDFMYSEVYRPRITEFDLEFLQRTDGKFHACHMFSYQGDTYLILTSEVRSGLDALYYKWASTP